MSLGVGIGLDQPTVRGTANNANSPSRACMARAPDLMRCRCNPRLRYLHYLRYLRFPCFDAIPHVPWPFREKVQAK